MSVLAHPTPFAVPGVRRRRHLELVPSPAPERLADVLPFPAAPALRPARPAPATRAQRSRVQEQVPLRLTARGRRVLVGLALVVAAVVGSVAGSVVADAQEPTAVEMVTVRSGDSLWSIAAAAAAPGADVRDVMSQIAALNDLEGATLVAGQVLSVPSGD